MTPPSNNSDTVVVTACSVKPYSLTHSLTHNVVITNNTNSNNN